MRERIMSVAIEEMNEKGRRFTMDDLAKRLGVSKRTLYENFRSKEQLISTVMDLFLDNVMEKDRQIINNETLSTIEKLRELTLVIENELKYINEKTIYQSEKYYPKQWKKIDAWLKKRAMIQKEIIYEGIKKGELRNINPDILIKVLNEAKNWIIDKKFLRENNLTISEAVGSLVDIVLFGAAKK
ncbi:MAG: TetR/AcrR family transcriptional regulator [Maledivibacter sp.]|jgi:AcrR family transcriptional regulator|nr:TetR/AcrR family transcriptional regulator [Maledivibacter sp.]